jgi:hypothetical protein
MELPRDLCTRLSKIDPNARLGFGRAHPALPPCFSIIKLYPVRDMERSLYAPDEWRSRGPIFNRHGKNTPDWDLLSRIPCSMGEVAASEIESRHVVDLLLEWSTDIRDRKYANLLKLAQEEDAMMGKLSGEMADYAQWHNRHSWKIGEGYSMESEGSGSDSTHDCGDYKNRYWQELEIQEALWRREGWIPPNERN